MVLFGVILIIFITTYVLGNRKRSPLYEEWVTMTEKRWAGQYPTLYKEVKREMMHGARSYVFSLQDIDGETMDDMIECLVECSREETYVDSWELWEDEGEGEIRFDYELPREEIERQRQIVQREVKRMVHRVIHSDMTDTERVKALYDDVVTQVVYDDDLAEREAGIDAYGYHCSNTAYGALTEHIAVCEGFARLFVALLDAVHIENYYVQGLSDGEGHAWNLVHIDGRYLYFDATTDARTPHEALAITYEDFLVRGKQLDYEWNDRDYPRT